MGWPSKAQVASCGVTKGGGNFPTTDAKKAWRRVLRSSSEQAWELLQLQLWLDHGGKEAKDFDFYLGNAGSDLFFDMKSVQTDEVGHCYRLKRFWYLF